MTVKLIIAITAATILSAGAAVAAEPEATSLATRVCSACHGAAGISISPVFPNLAGQQAAYVMLQLDAFRSHQRGDPNAQAYMWGMASQLSDDTIQALANYYAAQKPATIAASKNAALLASGKKIYTEGISAQNVAACASCHGANAEGAAAFPRLSGQHVDYLVAQLQGFKSGLRANAPIMLGVTQAMTTEEMTAVATYAASR
jgi:cytochrome c553